MLAASCLRTPTPGMKVKTADRARQDRAPHGRRTADHRPAGAWTSRTIRTASSGRSPSARRSRPAASPSASAIEVPAPDRSHVAMAVNLDACIQCNLCVRACREVQVNDVIGMAGRGHLEKIVFDFDDPMGALDLRRLRRVRAGLPDRRADAVDHGGREQRLSRQARPHGGQRLPVLRRRLPAHLPDQGRQDRRRHRQERPGQREPALRQGPLRLRLRAQPAAPAEADDPQGRRAEGAARVHRSVEPVDAFPRGDVGGGARPRRRRPQENPRPRRLARRWPASARPRARTKRPICSRSWCAPASAPTTSTTARGSATPRRWRRCSKASARPRSPRPSTR